MKIARLLAIVFATETLRQFNCILLQRKSNSRACMENFETTYEHEKVALFAMHALEFERTNSPSGLAVAARKPKK